MKILTVSHWTLSLNLAMSAAMALGTGNTALAQDRFPVAGQPGMPGYAAQPNAMPPNANQGYQAPMQPNRAPAPYPSQGVMNMPAPPAQGGIAAMPAQIAPAGGAYDPAANLNPQARSMQAPGTMPSPAGGFQMPANVSPGSNAQPGAGGALSAQAQRELQDFGVPPTTQLHAGAMHGPTPVQIPGGRVTTTEQLSAALQSNQNQILLFHVLGGRETLPNAQYAMPASAPGTFNDQTQQAFTQYLSQVTKGQKGTPMVFYCASPQCWMSYNAALRAINGGYSNVIWYRGGIEAWKAAGLPTTMQ